MSSWGRRRNRKKSKQFRKETTDYTVQNFVDDEVDKFGKEIEAVMAEAKAGGMYGVMIIDSEAKVYVSDLVPFGRVWRAGSSAAVERMRELQGRKQD